MSCNNVEHAGAGRLMACTKKRECVAPRLGIRQQILVNAPCPVLSRGGVTKVKLAAMPGSRAPCPGCSNHRPAITSGARVLTTPGYWSSAKLGRGPIFVLVKMRR